MELLKPVSNKVAILENDRGAVITPPPRKSYYSSFTPKYFGKVIPNQNSQTKDINSSSKAVMMELSRHLKN